MATITPVQASDTPNSGRNKINGNFTNLNNELGDCIHQDGSVAMEAPLNMGGYRGINASAGINPTDLVIKQQLSDEVNKFVIDNVFDICPSYPNDSTSHRFTSVTSALSALPDATVGNRYTFYITDNGKTAVSETVDDWENYINYIGENAPIITVNPNPADDAVLSVNGLVENIRFRFDSSIVDTFRIENGWYRNCIFNLANGSANIIMGSVKMDWCKLIVGSSSTISLDGTTYSKISFCEMNKDIIVGSAVNDGIGNVTIPNLTNYYNY